MEDYHTHYLGSSKNGKLFWGYETFIFTKPYAEVPKESWPEFRKEYAILHTFEKDGTYLATKHWSTITANSDSHLIPDKLTELVSELGDIEFKDIKIKLFKTIIDGTVFGLIPDKETESIELQPSSTISFQKPWDGEYST